MALHNHPSALAVAFAAQLPPGSAFEFSAYRKGEDRRMMSVPTTGFSLETAVHLFTQLAVDEELAWHSRVWLPDAEVLHVPMVDFVAPPAAEPTMRVARRLRRYQSMGLTVFASGRSMHGYGDRLVDQTSWYQFMGGLLLANRADGPPVVDWRWVGHRIVKGYAALRWSANTAAHTAAPERLHYLELDAPEEGFQDEGYDAE